MLEAAERRFFDAWVDRPGDGAAAVPAPRSAVPIAGAAGPCEDRRHRPVPEAGSAAVSVAIVDYGSGNLHSAAKAFERAAREAGRHSRSW